MTRDTREKRCKVGRIIDEYGLDGLGDELERRWTDDEDRRSSLRELARHFNEHVLRAALSARNEQPVSESVENMYLALVDDDVTTPPRKRVESELERSGVDVDSLVDDFVSHQAIHTYLTKYRNLEPPVSDANPVETAERTINRLQSRITAVAETHLDRLARKDELVGADVEVFVTVEVFCNDCGTSRTVSEYLASGGCDCRNSL